MSQSFLEYFVPSGTDAKISDVQASVILGGTGEEMYGVKYFENEEDAKLFAEIIADFMSDALTELDLTLTLETKEGSTEWP